MRYYEKSCAIILSVSKQQFSVLQDFFEDAVSLANMQLGGLLLDNSAFLLDCYVDILIKAVPKPRFDNSLHSKDIVLAETEGQQLGLWANASAFAEEILPREESRKRAQSTTSSSRGSVTREWKRRLQRSAERLRDLYCQNQVLDLFFNEEGLSNINADAYLLLEDDADSLPTMPSPLFQELFFKLNKLNQVAGDVLPGRERTTISLLSKLLETFVLILEDHGFWEGIEAGARPLGQAGLQQFVLDMHFVIQIATQGHYSTRRIGTVVLEIINRAIEAFNAEGLDPYSILPEDEWFQEVAAGCIRKLSLQNSNSLQTEKAPIYPHLYATSKNFSWYSAFGLGEGGLKEPGRLSPRYCHTTGHQPVAQREKTSSMVVDYLLILLNCICTVDQRSPTIIASFSNRETGQLKPVELEDIFTHPGS
ncbi:hypothetical protein L7F22_003309 [Adiantum nelumboides]|nr:hypothetical protein [Adiantum nelumboides]